MPKTDIAGSVQIRWMIRRDMPEVLDIEHQSFEFAWTEEDFFRCLRQQNCIGMIAEREGKLVGFMIYELLKKELRVINFAVAPWSRRLGVGSQMIANLASKLKQQKRESFRMDVREKNLQAQLFLSACGLVAEKVVRGSYEDTNEDAYRFVYRLGW